MKYTEEEIAEAIPRSQSKSDVCRKFGLPINGTGLRIVDNAIKKYDINTNHFLNGGAVRRKYPIITKICPVCNKQFKEAKGSPRERTTCSYACSNTYFRTKHGGCQNGNRDSSYRGVCFQHWKKKCAICGWDKIVEVHHIDGNNQNHDPKNLIPLCPNHHALVTTKLYKDEIEQQIQQLTCRR